MGENTKIARRGFFAGLGLAVVAGVAAKLTSQAAPVAASVTPPDSPVDGYRLTEHVKKYYRTTI